MVFSVAAIQMISGDNVQDNLDTAAGLIAQAASQGAQLIVLPEMFACFGNGRAQLALAKNEIASADNLQVFLAEQARRHHCYLVAGTIPLVDTENDVRCSAATLLFSPEGTVQARYNKIHLFDADVGEKKYRESDMFVAGNEVVLAQMPFGAMGLSVCYDLRFPELYRLMQQQAEASDLNLRVLVVPAAFTRVTGDAHWLPLLRARAIESQYYVIAANQGGVHFNGRETGGDSVIIDPWGEVLACLPTGEGCVVASLDFDKQDRQRQSLPALQHRRFFVTDKIKS